MMAELDSLFVTSEKYIIPERLSEQCYRVICVNLDIISYKNIYGQHILRKGLALPNEICEKIIQHVLLNKKINDDDCFFTIFNNTTNTKLKCVKIVNSNLSDSSVQILARHKCVELEFTDCNLLTHYSIEYINQNSQNLQTLVLTSELIPTMQNPSIKMDVYPIPYVKRGYVFKTPNLRKLVLGYVKISARHYAILLAGLKNLTHLDLSNNYDIGNFYFHKMVPNLVSLSLYNVKLNVDPKPFATNICHLKHLRHLDISQSIYAHGQFDEPDEVLATIVNGLPELMSLDISGTNLAGKGIVQRPIKQSRSDFTTNNQLCDICGLSSRIQRPLQFLGLYGTSHGACMRHDIPAKVISGDANEDQILIAAHVCMDNKPELLQKVLNELYYLFRYEDCNRLDHALHTVLEAMEKHPNRKEIQIPGSATLYYIVKMKEKGEIPLGMRRRITSTLIAGMVIHKDEETIMRNGCLALCQFRIPQDVMWNYETLVRALLHSAKYAEPESMVQRIGTYLLNSLACQVDGKEKRLLGKLGCVKTMLQLVTYRLDSDLFDDVLEIAWSTMWNMTDETPINCQRFLNDRGMMLFLRCVKQYPHKEELFRNIMGLLGNVAEVDYLRVQLMEQRYVSVFANLLHSNSGGIEVSYSAAGILAHMASDGVRAWTIASPRRDEVLQLMVRAIERWDLGAERNINYRSFLPLLRLLDIYHTPECQHWAVWALANLTNVYPEKYCKLVVSEKGIEKLHEVMKDSRPYETIKKLANLVCENCRKYNEHSNDTNINSTSSERYSLN